MAIHTPQISSETYVQIKIRQIWVMIACTVVACSTLLGVYYNFKSTFDMQVQKNEMELRLINMRLDRLEREHSFSK